MCRVLKIARAGYYAWLHEPESNQAELLKINGYYSSSDLLMMLVMVFMVIVALLWILKN